MYVKCACVRVCKVRQRARDFGKHFLGCHQGVTNTGMADSKLTFIYSKHRLN